MTFITVATGVVGSPLHVSVYDNAGIAVAPALISWSGLPADAAVSPDAIGFNFTRTVVGAFAATATAPGAAGSVTLNFTAPPPAPLKFTNP